jgi:hypothetical protein
MAASETEDAVAGSKSAVPDLQVQAPQQRRQPVANDALCFIYCLDWGGRQGGQPFE